MTNQLIAAIITALAIAAAIGIVLIAIAGFMFWSLEERPQTEESDELRKH
jgi:flagellar basal body-associated protein FliL